MNWLILQSAGEHDGKDGLTPNAHMRECLSIKRALESLGETALVWGPRHPEFEDKKPIDPSLFDRVLYFDIAQQWMPDPRMFKNALKIHWVVDSHCNSSRAYAPLTGSCDLVLHSNRLYVEKYSKEFPGRIHAWFPSCFDDAHFKLKRCKRTVPFLFVGNVLNRGDVIERLKASCGMEHRFATGADYVNALQTAMIHFNKSISNNVTYRVFETIATGTCLCTDHLDELGLLGFVDGENCLIYRDLDECERKVKECLEKKTYGRIGAAGLELSKRHTFNVRFGLLKKFISEHFDIR